MYRTAAKRLISGGLLAKNGIGRVRSLPHLQSLINRSRFSTVTPESPANQTPNQFVPPGTPNIYGPTSSSSSSSSSSDFSASSTAEEARHHGRKGPRADYQEEQTRVLQASLPHVVKLGWTEAAMIAGARDVGLSPSIVGSFPRKEAALVEFFMDDCLQRLIDKIDSEEELNNLIPSERISKLVRFRLEMQAPYISKWPQALSVQALPLNVPISFKQRAMLVDEIWHAVGDDASAVDWYVKRTLLGGIYSTTEVYMLTDSSPDFRDTWVFLDNRLKDAFDLKKSFQEAKYLAETVGAGLGGSLQGFAKKVFPG